MGKRPRAGSLRFEMFLKPSSNFRWVAEKKEGVLCNHGVWVDLQPTVSCFPESSHVLRCGCLVRGCRRCFFGEVLGHFRAVFCSLPPRLYLFPGLLPSIPARYRWWLARLC